MTHEAETSNPAFSAVNTHKIKLWDGNSFGKSTLIQSSTPTGRTILQAFDLLPADEYVLVEFAGENNINEVQLDEELDLALRGAEKFFAFHNDRTYKVAVNGKRFSWGDESISVSLLRLIGGIEASDSLILELSDEPDRELDDSEVIALSDSGVERIYSKPKEWKLNVQGVVLTFPNSKVVVREALIQAGFDPNECWTAILKVKGQPKRPVELDNTIDLSEPGIEKLRLRPNEIKNGEAIQTPRRDFSLLDRDKTYLEKRNLVWETTIEGKRRWLILRAFSLPDGYSSDVVDIAMDVPTTYPAAAMDMFYCSPSLSLENGKNPDKTSSTLNIEGKKYQQWSRHLNGATRWNPQTDSVISHIAFIEDSLSKEVE